VAFTVTESGEVRGMTSVPADQRWFWTEQWQAGEREAAAQIAPGQSTVYPLPRRCSPTQTSQHRLVPKFCGHTSLPPGLCAADRCQRERFKGVELAEFIPDADSGRFRPGLGSRVRMGRRERTR